MVTIRARIVRVSTWSLGPSNLPVQGDSLVCFLLYFLEILVTPKGLAPLDYLSK